MIHTVAELHREVTVDSKKIGIALVGCGTVGGSTARLILDEKDSIKKRTGLDLNLVAIVDKDFTTAKQLNLPETLFQADLDKALSNPAIQVVIELVGGTGFAKELTIKALEAKKSVVTANKALLAQHGKELHKIAQDNNQVIGFEASCGGGIPIIRALTDGLMANSIDALFGIVNGTCNYILTEMIQKGTSYASALADAQKDGLAEADPSLDVEGIDSAHKIVIMGGLAFGAQYDLDSVPVKGIDTLSSQDVTFGSEMGYVIKLIASALKTKNGSFLRVEPAFIAEDHPLAWVSGSFNAVSVYGHAVGHTMYYGRGAGGNPTASAVVSDIISIGNGSYPLIYGQLNFDPTVDKAAKQLDSSEINRRYYVRLAVEDHAGVLARITKILSDHGISVSSIHQPEILSKEESGEEAPSLVQVILTSHKVQERVLLKALDEIESAGDVQKGSTIIPILDEHPEFLSL
jgi:homoserine dehydrogenase